MRKLITLFLFFLCTLLDAQVNLDSGLVLYYPFNGNVNDSSLNGINGTLMNGASYTYDHLGNANRAVFFDGIDDFVVSDSSLLLDGLINPISISAWVRIDGWYNSWGAAWAPIISKSTSGGVQYRIALQDDSTFWIAPFVCNSSAGISIPSNNNWFNIVLIQDSTNNRIFINGSIVTTFTCGTFITPTNYPLFIGYDPHNVDEFFSGAIDEVRIFDRALSIQEINVLTSVSVLGIIQQKVSTYPNPSAGLFTFDGIEKNTVLEVFDITGRMIQSEIYTNSTNKIDISNKAKGIYLYRITQSGGRVQQGKLVLQ